MSFALPKSQPKVLPLQRKAAIPETDEEYQHRFSTNGLSSKNGDHGWYKNNRWS